MIKINNLNKSFFNIKILQDINLEIEPGKLTTLLGQNGCGKSTLLNILSGFELPDTGVITYKEKKLDEINFPYVHDIFFVHEKLNYMLLMTIGEYIDLLRAEIPNWDNEAFLRMLRERKINLNNNFQNYSRGQKMQILLMMGLASNAPILLLDEITSVIDVYGRKYFLDLLAQYVKKGNTVVITTNIINELEFYTDRLVVIKDKKIVLNKAVEDIPMQFIKIRKETMINHPVFNHKDCVWAGVNSDKSISYIIPLALTEKIDIPKELIDKRKSTLEDVFIYYFTQNENEHENVA